jgi:hypothetical protein
MLIAISEPLDEGQANTNFEMEGLVGTTGLGRKEFRARFCGFGGDFCVIRTCQLSTDEKTALFPRPHTPNNAVRAHSSLRFQNEPCAEGRCRFLISPDHRNQIYKGWCPSSNRNLSITHFHTLIHTLQHNVLHPSHSSAAP